MTALPVQPPLVEIACPVASAGSVRFRGEVTLDHRRAVLGDIADLSALPSRARARASTLEIGEVRGRAGDVSVAPLLARLRARMPLLGCFLPRSPAQRVRVRVVADGTVVRRTQSASFETVWSAPPAVSPGDRVSLSTAAGAVRIERQVEALQAARPGQRLFVRDVDGRSFSVLYPGPAR